VHRDIKPANLFLACRPDGGNVIKMLDFGISKAMRSRPEEKKLTGQAVLGSPVYMSPEQLRNAKDIDARADIWSLGIVAYELLSGKPPFDGDGVGEIFAAILEKDPVPIHTVNWRLPPEISDIIAKCLQRKPEDRWTDAAALARALKPFGSGTWSSVIERAEQVLTRAKLLKKTETPSEARRVVAALNEVAERARTTGGGRATMNTPDAFPLTLLKPAPDSQPGVPPAPDSARGLVTAPTKRMGVTRWIGAAAAALVILGAAVAVARSGRASAADKHRPGNPAVASVAAAPDRNRASGASGASGAGEPEPATGEDGAPMVMDLPDSPGQTGDPKRSRNTKPGKPARPKFLNTRE
jgi:serine/threonine-protein kinase